MFGDFGTPRSIIGVNAQDDISMTQMTELNEKYEEQEGGLSPYAGMEHFGSYFRILHYGYEHLGLEEPLHSGRVSGVAIWHPKRGPDFPQFLSVDITFPEDKLVSNLPELGYEKAEHQGTTFYTIHEDHDRPIAYPWRLDAGINRIAFVNGRLLAAAATDIMTSLIDVEQDRVPSLADNEAHQAFAETVGQDLLSGAFYPYSVINRDWAPGSISDYKRGAIIDGPDRWESLSVYELVLIGYKLSDRGYEIVVGLFYPDPEAADGDALKLQHRWETFVAVAPYEGSKLAQACAPLSTEVIQGEGYSILAGSCPVLLNKEAHPAFRTARLWRNIQTAIFTQDIEKLKKATE